MSEPTQDAPLLLLISYMVGSPPLNSFLSEITSEPPLKSPVSIPGSSIWEGLGSRHSGTFLRLSERW